MSFTLSCHYSTCPSVAGNIYRGLVELVVMNVVTLQDVLIFSTISSTGLNGESVASCFSCGVPSVSTPTEAQGSE